MGWIVLAVVMGVLLAMFVLASGIGSLVEGRPVLLFRWLLEALALIPRPARTLRDTTVEMAVGLYETEPENFTSDGRHRTLPVRLVWDTDRERYPSLYGNKKPWAVYIDGHQIAASRHHMSRLTRARKQKLSGTTGKDFETAAVVLATAVLQRKAVS